MVALLEPNRRDFGTAFSRESAFNGPEHEARGDVTSGAKSKPLDNAAVARRLDELAELLQARAENPFRVRSYRRAAQVIRELAEPVQTLLDREGVDGLENLPGIGKSLARSIEMLTRTGHLALLDRLRAASDPTTALSTVSGIGHDIAARIYEQLGISTLDELEAAAIDGRLGRVPGMGRKRLRSVVECLSGRGRQTTPSPPSRAHFEAEEIPPVAELLDVDREYGDKAAAGKLPMIAPRRFNPTGEAWLPILHTERHGRHYTALYSNTARAHELGTTHDWVVIYLDDESRRYQCTAITSRFGSLRGHRIIRGREDECREHYDQIKEQKCLPL